jgi:tetratricopeptide (TPR) repeat protein
MAPDNPVGYYRLGFLQRALRQHDAAVYNFEKALALNPNLMDVFTNLILVHASQKEYDRALKRCDSQLQLVDNAPLPSAVINNLKGGLYLAQGNKAAAIESYRTAIEENPNLLQPYYSLARIYLADRQEEKAIAQYKAMLEVNSQQAQPHMLLGILYDTHKQYDLSEKHYRAALDINPEFVPAANNLAFILIDQDRNFDEALGLARMAKEKLPNNPYIMDTLGWVYYKKGLYDLAIGEFSDSLAKIPDNAAVIYHLGMAYYKKGEKDKAREQLEKALNLQPDFPGSEDAKRVLAEL